MARHLPEPEEGEQLMGVNILLLDRRPARLDVGGVVQSVGTLRSFWKMTELDEERAAEGSGC